MIGAVRVCTLLLIAVVVVMTASGQDISGLKMGVVRIKNSRSSDVGSGYIVKITKDLIYIVTASHVVKNEPSPQVYFFNRQHHEPLAGKVLDRELDSDKGLALLTVKVNDAKMLEGLRAYRFTGSTQLTGGEDFKTIGFPDGTSFWTINNGVVSRVEGNYLVLSGSIREGNSGGPVILSNSHALGLVVVAVESQSISYAPKSEIIVSYINGIVPNLVSLEARSQKGDQANPIGNETIVQDEFCKSLNGLVKASEGGFYSIIGSATQSENVFTPSVLLPGASTGYVEPKKEVYYYLLVSEDKRSVEARFYTTVADVRKCLATWEEKEETNYYRYHRFMRPKHSTIVNVYYNPDAKTNNGKHFLTISVRA